MTKRLELTAQEITTMQAALSAYEQHVSQMKRLSHLYPKLEEVGKLADADIASIRAKLDK